MKKKVIVIGMTNILGGVETFIRNTYLRKLVFLIKEGDYKWF